MNSQCFEFWITKCFCLVGACIMTIGVICMVGQLAIGSDPIHSLMCVLTGGFLYYMARRNHEDLIKEGDRE